MMAHTPIKSNVLAIISLITQATNETDPGGNVAKICPVKMIKNKNVVLSIRKAQLNFTLQKKSRF